MGSYWTEIADQNQTERQIEFLKTHLNSSGCILDVACGSGRHLIPLSKLGFDMVGLDISVKLLRIAKQRYPEVQVVKGDMRFLPFKAEAFSAAIAMDTSFGYLPSDREDAQTLDDIRRALISRGQFIIDVFNRQNLDAKYQGKTPSEKVRKYPTFVLHQQQTVSEKGDRRLDVWEVHDNANRQVKVFQHSVRLYDYFQLEQLLANAALKIKAVFGDYEGQNFSVDSPELIFIAYAL